MTVSGKLLLTGGTGTLGTAIIARATKENWPCELTVFSRDEIKQQKLKREYPHVRLVLGDVADYDALEKAMLGHDSVWHLAAFKHIPAAERDPLACFQSNVIGSLNVAKAAMQTQVKQVIGISTDKACHPVNFYGSTKFQMERIFQDYAKHEIVKFNLARYGNVLGSTGSVIVDWRRKLKEQEYINSTDPDMSRFWLSVDQAIDIILQALDEPNSTITIPKLKGLPMLKMEEYILPLTTKVVYEGLRPGEKRHEELITIEEAPLATDCSYTMPFSKPLGNFIRLFPSTRRAPMMGVMVEDEVRENGYCSNNSGQLTKEELLGMIGE